MNEGLNVHGERTSWFRYPPAQAGQCTVDGGDKYARVVCPHCLREICVTKKGRFHRHFCDPKQVCPTSGEAGRELVLEHMADITRKHKT